MQATLVTEAHTGSALRSSVSAGPALVQVTDQQSASIQEDGNCFRGILLGLCLECVLGFCVYGMWHLWHLVR